MITEMEIKPLQTTKVMICNHTKEPIATCRCGNCSAVEASIPTLPQIIYNLLTAVMDEAQEAHRAVALGTEDHLHVARTRLLGIQNLAAEAQRRLEEYKAQKEGTRAV